MSRMREDDWMFFVLYAAALVVAVAMVAIFA
jgi:hypothetical protein